MNHNSRQIYCLIVSSSGKVLERNQVRMPQDNAEIVFLFDEDPDDQADWLMVCDQPPAGFKTRVPVERRVLFIMEPPEIWIYGKKFLRQFGHVNSPYPIPYYDGDLNLHNPCIQWFLGSNAGAGGSQTGDRFVFNDLSAYENYPAPKKTKGLSVICSDKIKTKAQIARIKFVNALGKYFGNDIDIFGRSVRPIDDKIEAIRDYKYHIVLENTFCENFFTEKLSDCWLGWSFPVYSGTKSIEELMPAPGLMPIDIFDQEGSIGKIKKLLEDDPYDRLLPSLKSCRDWCIKNTNSVTCMENIIKRSGGSVYVKKTTHETIYKEKKTLKKRLNGYWYDFLKHTMAEKLSVSPGAPKR